MSIAVDLNTRILPSSHGVFMVRPGKNYHLYKSAKDFHVVAPDVPLLDIPNGERPIDQDNLDLQVRRGRAFRSWAESEETRSEPLPETDLNQYTNVENLPHHNRFVNVVEEILWGLPEGSLSFIPDFSLASAAVFGELVGPKDSRQKITGGGRFSNFLYQGRKLRDVKPIPMRELPPTALLSKKKNTTIVQIEGRDRQILYRQYYGDFEILGQKSTVQIATTKPRFTGPDAAIIGALATMVQEAWQRRAHGESSVPRLGEAAFLDLGDDAPAIHANINSPGEVLLEAVQRTPHVVKVIIALALALTGPELYELAQSGAIDIVNTAHAAGVSSQETEETREFLFHFLNSAGADSVNEIVENIRVMNNRTGGNVDANIVTD